MRMINECPKCKIPITGDRNKCNWCNRETIVTITDYKPSGIPSTMEDFFEKLTYYLGLNVSKDDKLKLISELLNAIKRVSLIKMR